MTCMQSRFSFKYKNLVQKIIVKIVKAVPPPPKRSWVKNILTIDQLFCALFTLFVDNLMGRQKQNKFYNHQI